MADDVVSSEGRPARRMKVNRNGVVQQVPESFRKNLRTLNDELEFGEELTNLLAAGDSRKLNERAVVVARCQGRQAVYRVFPTQGGRLIGCPAQRPRGRTSRDQHRSRDRVIWLDHFDPPEENDTVMGSRCRCRPGHPQAVVKLADLFEAIATGQHSITVR
jgi:hypothetical protein